MNGWAIAWFAAWGGFFVGWKLGRKELAYWLVRSERHNDGGIAA